MWHAAGLSMLKRISMRQKPKPSCRLPHSWPGCVLSLLALTAPWRAVAGGTWSALAHPPPAGLNNALLLSDGSVMCGDGSSDWYRLTPDAHGSYVNGSWTLLAPTHYTR